MVKYRRLAEETSRALVMLQLLGVCFIVAMIVAAVWFCWEEFYDGKGMMNQSIDRV
jgi:hypothetical protein